MKTSAAGRAAIAQREGNKLQAYQDSVKVWTIGVGHTAAAGPPAPKRGMKITAAESDAILARDLHDVENDINALVRVPMTQNQFDALVSLVFNIGGGNFRKSSVLRKINAKDYGGAAAAFMSWNKAGGKVLAGLTTRRNAERKQFLNSTTPASARPAPVATIPIPEPPPAPAPTPAPTLVPVKVPGLDKPMVKSSTMWAALGGVGVTGVASVKELIGTMTGLDWRVTMAVVGVASAFAAYWIISERVRYRQAQRDMVAGVKAASAEQ